MGISYLHLEDDQRLAYIKKDGRSPGVIFVHGFRSDMNGTKAQFLEQVCLAENRQMTRFDCFGHGQSSGGFEQGTISQWVKNVTDILTHLTQGPQILIGSSMGAWLALRAAALYPSRIAGIITLAAAPDFTEELFWPSLNDIQRQSLEREGICYVKSNESDSSYPITRELIEDGRKHLILTSSLSLDCPVTLIHGMEDHDVPYHYSIKLAHIITSNNISITLRKKSDHRLSSLEDLTVLGSHLRHMFACLPSTAPACRKVEREGS